MCYGIFAGDKCIPLYNDSETDKFYDDLERLIKITNCKGVSIDDALEGESF